ncbi:MAG: sporulation integral membrane protein YtvI [Clostridiales bacterium]|nr:sporulation integral membrane protein YtvI [Clostridiales bacterium]
MVEKRRSFLINIAYALVIIAIFYIYFKYLFWVTAPFVLAFLFAVILQKPIRFLDRKTKKKCHTLWAILLVLLALLIIIVPLALIISQLVEQISNFAKYLMTSLADFPQFIENLKAQLLSLLSFLPESLYESVSASISENLDSLANSFSLSDLGVDSSTLTSTISSGISGVYSVVKNVPSAILGIVIGIIASILFAKDYNKVVAFIKLQLPQDKKNLLVEIKQVFSKTIFKMLKAYGIIMLITFCELSLGFSILKMLNIMNNNYIYLIAAATAVFDILPVAGSGGVLIPWALISLINGNTSQAIGLIIIYGVITAIRQYIEPKIVGDSLGVNPILTLAGLYFGLKLFGIIGMFLVPLCIMTLKAFNDTGRLKLWKTEQTAES